MKVAVNASSLTKNFGPVKAISNLSIKIEEGQVYGLLGPNGSGKSTLMKIIVGLIRPDGGEISIFGLRPYERPLDVRRIIGYVPENPRLYDFLTAREYLEFVSDLYGLDKEGKRDRIGHFLDAFDLSGREDEMLSGYSQGMRQKVAIIGSLLHRPRLLIMDEPLNGLDPRSAKIVKDLLNRLSREGVTTIFSTHVLEIAQAICNRIAILYRGSLVSEGTMDELKARAGMKGSSLEDIFFMLTGGFDVRSVVEELSR